MQCFACIARNLSVVNSIKRKSFSFLLARRYLNPRRSMLSSFTLISLVGVMLGVLVLIVVMAVYAGLERSVKNRLLGFTPHILLSNLTPAEEESRAELWQQGKAKAKAIPGVESVSSFISDNVILDFESWQRPVIYRGVDASDPAQVKGLSNMLDLVNYPGSQADIGIDDRIVVSSIIAGQLHLTVGDKVRLYSTRNFEEVVQTYKATENPPIRETFAESWQKASQPLRDAWQSNPAGGFTQKIDVLQTSYTLLDEIRQSTIRKPESEWLEKIMLEMEAAQKNEEKQIYEFSAEQKATITTLLQNLDTSDAEKLDGEILRGLKQIVLPREAVIAGVYQASQMAMTPDLFVPMPMAQSIAGLDDGDVQGIALRLTDPYQAQQVAAEGRKLLDPDWSLLTWGEQYQGFFALINQQRVMMYFALSFIVLVSAFSMMAVMFTVTIQKRREIGVMKALGATPGQIVRVFLYQGMILGVFGALLGVVLGRLVIHYRGGLQSVLRQLGFDPFAASFTGFDTLPAYNDPLEQFVIAVMAFVLCSLAALVPAFFAARSDAAKSLRNI
ncbi:MAG: ABC transporter permease [Verrucomicrobia bacterium]|nr:MAG: ABC transporter permease [Verrucomicrobiota bacterium]